mgnify:CR=1 FL=1
MTDMHVTMGAFQAFVVGCGCNHHIMDEILMALNAVGLQDVSVLLMNADRFVKVLQGEALGMPEAILSFGYPFADELVG